MITVKFQWLDNNKDLPLPSRATLGSAGFDVSAAIRNSVVLKPAARILVSLGFKLLIPDGYEAQIRPRSGNALKYGITVLNTPGTIDSDYRGEVGVILINHGEKDFLINRGDKIAQLIFSSVEIIDLKEMFFDDQTFRNNKGFGSTN